MFGYVSEHTQLLAYECKLRLTLVMSALSASLSVGMPRTATWLICLLFPAFKRVNRADRVNRA